ncbi:MAG TPA: SDR family NAD(P)-dependent oxidoreductase, partial [bacterium]|nr:SDR family NAD(P)-dependent oxidoreductase [bacterium]
MKGKTALITGSSQGIGKAIAIKLALLGANIALNDIESQEQNLKELKSQIEAKGVKTQYFLADVSNLGQTKKMAEDIKQEFGSLDVLVNNAGITKDRTLAKMTEDEWQRVIDIDLTGVFNVTKSCLPLIISNKGKIVSISSVVGQHGNFGQTNYAAAKAGVIGFTKSLSKE